MPDKHSNIPAKDANTLLRLAVEAHVLDVLYGRHQELKERVAGEFTPGERHEVKNAQGLKLGSVGMSSPNKKAVPTDEHVILAQAQDKGMDLIDDLPRSGTEAYQQAVDVLYEHAPHLLTTTVAADDVKILAAEVLAQWQITGEVPAGWKITDASAPKFSLTKARTAQAKAAVAHLATQIEHTLSIEAPKGEQ